MHGNDVHQPGQLAALGIGPEHAVEYLCRLLDPGIFQGEQAHRHTRQHVDVKGRHHVQPAPQLRLGARQDQEVAAIVDTHEGLFVRHRAQNIRHGAGADVLQGHHHSTVPRARGARATQSRRQARGLAGAGDQEAAAAIPGHDDIVGFQQ